MNNKLENAVREVQDESLGYFLGTFREENKTDREDSWPNEEYIAEVARPPGRDCQGPKKVLGQGGTPEGFLGERVKEKSTIKKWSKKILMEMTLKVI